MLPAVTTGISQSSDQSVARDNAADTMRSAPWVMSAGAFISFTLLLNFVAGSSRKNGIWLTEFMKRLNSRFSKTKRQPTGTMYETVLEISITCGEIALN